MASLSGIFAGSRPTAPFTPDTREIFTKTRADFIHAMARLGATMRPILYGTPAPVILIGGDDVGNGKCLVVDAMIAQWSDGHDMSWLLAGERHWSMLESRRCEAMMTQTGTITAQGRPLSVAFNSTGNYCYYLFKDGGALAAHPGPVFITNADHILPGQHEARVALRLYVHGMAKTNGVKNWQRSVTMTVHDQRLWASPGFQHFWQPLHPAPLPPPLGPMV